MPDTDVVVRVVAGLVAVVALIHLSLAFGLRRGELVWGGYHPRRLPPDLRRRSLWYGLLLLISSWLVLGLGGLVDLDLIPPAWHRSVGWVVMALLGLMGLYTIRKGPAWERFGFGPIVVVAAALAGWLGLT